LPQASRENCLIDIVTEHEVGVGMDGEHMAVEDVEAAVRALREVLTILAW